MESYLEIIYINNKIKKRHEITKSLKYKIILVIIIYYYILLYIIIYYYIL